MEKDRILVSESGEYCGAFTHKELKERFIRVCSRKVIYTDGENYYQMILLPKVRK